MNKRVLSPEILFLGCVAVIAALVSIGPAEKSLGVNVRVVYLHGAWVWTALAGFLAAAGAGLAAFALRRESLHRWSRALGRTGLFFWVTYLPISLWAMQTNWNGLFLAEPRWRLALTFAVVGLLAQTGLTLIEDPRWASGVNIGYAAALLWGLQHTEKVMHPPSPILSSDAVRIQAFFALLMVFTLLSGWQVARWWHRRECVAS